MSSAARTALILVVAATPFRAAHRAVESRGQRPGYTERTPPVALAQK